MPGNLSFLLVGKSGSGKSALGNSILGQKTFHTSDSSTSDTTETCVARTFRCGYHITVIDTPGCMHTGLDKNEAKKKYGIDIKNAMFKCQDDSISAIVLVFKYGERFTEENKITLNTLKLIFGGELYKSCVIVLSFGDCFQLEYQNQITFEDWLKKEKGELGELFRNCKYRCVMFNNETNDLQESEIQFLKLIDVLKDVDHKYTKETFKRAEKEQNRLEFETNLQKKKFIERMDTLEAVFQKVMSHSKSLNKLKKIVNIMDYLLWEMKKADSPDIIYYKENEHLLLEKQRWRLEIMLSNKERDIRILEIETDFSHVIENVHENCSLELDDSFINLWNKIQNNKEFRHFKSRLQMVDNEWKRIKLTRKRQVIISEFEPKINKLRENITHQKIPTLVSTFTEFSKQVAEMTITLKEHNQEVGELDDLLSELNCLKKLVEFRKEDNDIWIGWTSTTGIMAGASIGTGFIPIVGIPISVSLNAIPILGRAIHLSVVRYKRSKK